MSTVHAYAAYAVDPTTGEFQDTIQWEYRGGEWSEQWAYAQYAANNAANSAELAAEGTAYAVAVYAVECPDGLTGEALADYMDSVEWDNDWRTPAVTILKRNAASVKRDEYAAARAAEKVAA